MLVLPECTHPYLFVGFWTFSSSLNSLSSQDVWQNVTSFRIHRAHDHVCNTSIHIHVWKRTYVCLKIKMYTGVAKNRGTTKWMVYNGKPYWDGWFGGSTILGNPHYVFIYIYIMYIYVTIWQSQRTTILVEHLCLTRPNIMGPSWATWHWSTESVADRPHAAVVHAPGPSRVDGFEKVARKETHHKTAV